MRKGIDAITGGEAPAHRRKLLVGVFRHGDLGGPNVHGRSGHGLLRTSNQEPVRHRTANLETELGV